MFWLKWVSLAAGYGTVLAGPAAAFVQFVLAIKKVFWFGGAAEGADQTT
jgi:hypothetical protein